MSNEVAVYSRMEEVVDLTLKGFNPVQVSRKLDINIREVNTILSTWRELALDDRLLKERARVVLAGYDAHTGELIKKLYEVIDEADGLPVTTPQTLAQKVSAVKAIAELEQKRLTALRDMGLVTDAETATIQAELDRKLEIMDKVLREVVMKCDHCRTKVLARLSEINGKVVPVYEQE